MVQITDVPSYFPVEPGRTPVRTSTLSFGLLGSNGSFSEGNDVKRVFFTKN
jgi:hypothetical protein